MTLTLSDPSLLCTKALIGGIWSDARDGARLAVTNPSTGESREHSVPSALSANEVSKAICEKAEAAPPRMGCKNWQGTRRGVA